MKTFTETSLSNFDAWSGAVDTKNTIIENNKEDEFDSLIDELYPDGIDETDTQRENFYWQLMRWRKTFSLIMAKTVKPTKQLLILWQNGSQFLMPIWTKQTKLTKVLKMKGNCKTLNRSF